MLHPTEIKRLRNTFKYLGAWFLLSDGPPHHLVIANKLTYAIRIHNNNINSDPLWENLLEHVIILPDPRRNPRTFLRDHRFPHLAFYPKKNGLE